MNTVDVEGVLNALRNVGQRSELLAALNDAKRVSAFCMCYCDWLAI